MTEAQSSTAQQQQAGIPVVDLTDDTLATTAVADVGNMVPQTPPAIAQPASPQTQAMDTGILPTKRPYEAMKAGIIQARKHSNTSYELHNYKPASIPYPGLRCWARLDLQADIQQQTLSTGPPMSKVQCRRTIHAISGDIILEEEMNENSVNQKLKEPTMIITELWHNDNAPHYVFNMKGGDIAEIDPSWDGSPDDCGPSQCNYYFKAYVNKLAHTVDDKDTTLSESDNDEFDDMSKGMPKKTRQEVKADEKELHWRQIMDQSPDYIQKFVEATSNSGDA